MNRTRFPHKISSSAGEPFPFEKAFPSTDAQRKLLERYPIFFRAARHPEIYTSSLGYWGIECGPGWYPLIDRAVSEIEVELQKLVGPLNSELHIPWLDNKLQQLYEDNKSEEVGMDFFGPLVPYCRAIKSKCGSLHINICNGEFCDGNTWLTIRTIVHSAESFAKKTCERCGNPGKLRDLKWERTLCDPCNGRD